MDTYTWTQIKAMPMLCVLYTVFVYNVVCVHVFSVLVFVYMYACEIDILDNTLVYPIATPV